jgi:hypothetical protein
MSVSSEVKRTLVKSPPELWSELSDPQALARHLGGLEEIHITRAEPESSVEWEADGTRGSVLLEPSGFGTRVILSLTRELPKPDRPAADTGAEPGADAKTATDAESADAAAEPGPLANTAAEPEAAAETLPEPEPARQTTVEFEMAILEKKPAEEASVEGTPERRPGFFARLFRRRNDQLSPFRRVAQRVASASELEAASDHEPSTEPAFSVDPHVVTEPDLAAEPEPAADPTPTTAPEPVAERELLTWPAQEPEQAAAPEPEPEPDPAEPHQVERKPTDIADDLAAVEAQMTEQDTALLTTVLDRLGAAHHRPFSRG